LRVIHASSKAVSRITRVSGSKIHCLFKHVPPYDRGCQETALEPPPVVEFWNTWRFG
jgi:hypothetical protein